MGGFRPSSCSWRQEYAAKELDKSEEEEEMKLAEKIAMVVIDRISQEIIRPGPDAEERECYEMAKELRDFQPRIVEIIERILEVEDH